MAVITISRQVGSGGDEVAARLASLLRFHVVKRAYLEKVIYEYFLVKTIRQLPLPEIIPPILDKSGFSVIHRKILEAILLNLAAKENIILVGYGGQHVFRHFKSSFHVRIVAPFNDRVNLLSSEKHISRAEASVEVRKKGNERRTFLKEVFGAEIGKQHYYDLILNMSRLSASKGGAIIASAFRSAIGDDLPHLDEYQEYMNNNQIEKIDLIPDQYQNSDPSMKVVFAHPSEEEFARVLNFYRIQWKYEPDEFPIEWDDQGSATESFRPDFYLPEYDTYIELTTMKQNLVTKKNRKIKKLRERYPHINLRIFYGKDYKKLLGKYGID